MTLVLVIAALGFVLAAMFRQRPDAPAASIVAIAVAMVVCVVLFEMGRLDG